MKKYFYFAFFLMLMACNQEKDTPVTEEANSNPTEEKKTIIPVKVMELTPQTFTEEGKFFGQVQGSAQADLITYTGGRVHKILKSDGAYVKKGDRLCDIEGAKYKLAYESAKLQENILTREYERAQAHFKSGSYSQLQLDQSNSKLLAAKQATLEAKKNNDAAWCVSPINGWVTGHSIQAHENLLPGSPTMAVANLHKIKVTVGIPENEISGYQKKGEASIKIPARPDTTFPATITSMAKRVDPKNRNFNVEVSLKNPQKSIKPGQTVEVILHKRSIQDALVIPNEILLNLEDGIAVMIVEDGHARRKMIQRGGANATHSHITKGLSSGDQIIISGQALAVDGTPVNIISE